ncbi:hypothetical protein NLN62_23375 [Bradyrhizobium sp. CCGUVB23]|nr:MULTISPECIES: hypothetical protein [unclassified Bradyrhizobium]MCP3463196.1 hypothetical protein [Bradyrhizobium sp. CCGUVB23]
MALHEAANAIEKHARQWLPNQVEIAALIAQFEHKADHFDDRILQPNRILAVLDLQELKSELADDWDQMRIGDVQTRAPRIDILDAIFQGIALNLDSDVLGPVGNVDNVVVGRVDQKYVAGSDKARPAPLFELHLLANRKQKCEILGPVDLGGVLAPDHPLRIGTKVRNPQRFKLPIDQTAVQGRVAGTLDVEPKVDLGHRLPPRLQGLWSSQTGCRERLDLPHLDHPEFP